ncbi:MAG: IS200/IS605 family transposase [Bacteroidota bacterium]
MSSYRKGSHTRYDLKIHIVWITKYRKPVLRSMIAKRVRELIREICLANEIQIIKGHVSKDHIRHPAVQLLISYPPRLSVAKIAQYLKGKTSRKLLQEFTEIKKQFWGQDVWARGYFAVSTGNVTDKVTEQYIENQGKEPPNEDFKIHDEP